MIKMSFVPSIHPNSPVHPYHNCHSCLFSKIIQHAFYFVTISKGSRPSRALCRKGQGASNPFGGIEQGAQREGVGLERKSSDEKDTSDPRPDHAYFMRSLKCDPLQLYDKLPNPRPLNFNGELSFRD